MKIPKGSTEWARMGDRFGNADCGICSHNIQATETFCEQGKCLVDVPISQNTLIHNLIKILEIE